MKGLLLIPLVAATLTPACFAEQVVYSVSGTPQYAYRLGGGADESSRRAGLKRRLLMMLK